MLENSSIFSSLNYSSSNQSSNQSSELTKDQLEEFRQMMLGDKVMVGCDEIIEEFEDEEGLLECLVYLWQQNSSRFRKNLPLPIKEWFLSKFTKPSEDLILYKGMHFERDKNVDLMSINSSGSFITSTTIDRSLAADFANGHKNCWRERNHILCIYKVTGDLVFDVKPYRDFDEEEFIVYNPKFELIEILN